MRSYIFILMFALSSIHAQAAQRYAFNSFTEDGYGCNDSVQRALFACDAWLSDFSSNHTLLEPPICPQQYCTCAPGSLSQSTCPGQAKYEDNADCPGPSKYAFQSFQDSGFNCYEAVHNAVTSLYQWVTDFSTKESLQAVRVGNCTCSNNSGIAQAVCPATILYNKCK